MSTKGSAPTPPEAEPESMAVLISRACDRELLLKVRASLLRIGTPEAIEESQKLVIPEPEPPARDPR